MGISDRIVVLHEGAVLREGPPEDVAHDPEVIAVYLSGAKAEPA
jgi:branched-chain amino acid transport system ATP-binding protein